MVSGIGARIWDMGWGHMGRMVRVEMSHTATKHAA